MHLPATVEVVNMKSIAAAKVDVSAEEMKDGRPPKDRLKHKKCDCGPTTWLKMHRGNM